MQSRLTCDSSYNRGAPFPANAASQLTLALERSQRRRAPRAPFNITPHHPPRVPYAPCSAHAPISAHVVAFCRGVLTAFSPHFSCSSTVLAPSRAAVRRGAHRAADDGRGRGYVLRLHHGFAWGYVESAAELCRRRRPSTPIIIAASLTPSRHALSHQHHHPPLPSDRARDMHRRRRLRGLITTSASRG